MVARRQRTKMKGDFCVTSLSGANAMYVRNAAASRGVDVAVTVLTYRAFDVCGVGSGSP